VTIMAGSSDHAPFRAAGVPALMWKQKGKNPVPYYLHTQKDTYENVVPSYLEHSAAVIALAALGTANLDHMLSRKNLTKKDNGAHDGPVSTNR
jgi:Zn-dependent M28 family amino/carboxypeptidase